MKVRNFADCIPNVYTTRELGILLAKTVKSGEKLLILRAENGSPELTRILADNNIDFDDVKTYDIQLEKNRTIPLLILTSSLLRVRRV